MKDDSLAQEIADAAKAAASNAVNNVEPFLSMMESKRPPAQTIAKALVLSSAHYGGIHHAQLVAILQSQLQLALTREHVAAQGKMTIAADLLAAAALVFAVVQLIVSAVEVFGHTAP